jgi:energy-coupling factor transport system ATP-binding protein
MERGLMGIIKAVKLAYEYARRDEDDNVLEVVRAVDGVDMDIERGTFLAILGRNGSGKSTLAKHINALLFPTEGTIWVEDIDTKDEDRLLDVRQTAGMVFQNPDNQIIATVVEEDVGFGPENMGVPTKEIWERVDECLTAVGMAAYRKSSPDRLSGGQKQRVAIAGVMAMRPKCIILDEPTAMLDPNGRKDVIRIAHELNRELGITIILITHYMEETVDADEIMVMDSGKVRMSGTPREIFSRVEELKALHLDVPQVTELSYRLRKRGMELPACLLTLPEFEKAMKDIPHAKGGGRTAAVECSHDSADAATASGLNSADAKAAGAARAAAGSSRGTADAEEGSDGTAGVDVGSDWTADVAVGSRGTADAAERSGSEAIIELKNVNYIYNPGTPMERYALTDVSLAVYKEDFIGVIGHTGSGKSTLVQHLDGLLKATSGDVLFHGRSIYSAGFDMKNLRSKVVLVFQYPEHQLFEADVLSDVCFGPKNLGMSHEEAVASAKEALRLVGVAEDNFSRSPFELSGGQKRRVAIAGALAMHPEVLVLDEPTAGLDPGGRDEILDTIAKLHREKDMAVVLVSHSMEDVATYADRLVVVNDGGILFDDTPRSVFRHTEELERIGLSAPQVTYINRALIEDGWGIRDDLTTLDEAEEAIIAAWERPAAAACTPKAGRSSDLSKTAKGGRSSDIGKTPEGGRPSDIGKTMKDDRPSNIGEISKDNRSSDTGRKPESNKSSDIGKKPEGGKPSDAGDSSGNRQLT